MKISNSYFDLGDQFYQKIAPTPVKKPQLLLWNKALAQELNFTDNLTLSSELIAQYLSGNNLFDNSQPIALAYSGHQFGHFTPYLGDGRAHLLGEVTNINGKLKELQLKGSGVTQYSRQGDGRYALAPAIREYIMSEAMYALGIPTSRCLAVVSTGENVYREQTKPGAIVTRVATSHIRVGTFQYFAAHGNLTALNKLTRYAINRHFPDIDPDSDNAIIEFLQQVMDKQIELVVEWQRVGFIHGVMNTDNTLVSGETIDFGPCAMMGVYSPEKVFSSIDKYARYAFGQQGSISLWNIARLAETLLPIIDDDQDIALEKVEPLIQHYQVKYQTAYNDMFAQKLGFPDSQQIEIELISSLLNLMQEQQLDYTQTFAQLTNSLVNTQEAESLKANLGNWYQEWLAALKQNDISLQTAKRSMATKNPVVIPRNHHIEAIVNQAEQTNDMHQVEKFLNVLRAPYQLLADTPNYQDLPTDNDENYRTFCGT